MNKKFLSVILFGALMTATTSTFTSCKDYDDDIDNLQEQLDKKATAEDLNSKVSALESEIAAAKSSAEDAAKKAQEALDKATGAGTVTDADLEALKTDLEAKIAKLAALKDVEEQIANLKSELTNAIAGKASQEELKALAEKVAKLQNEALNLIGRQLTSLVFKPDFYYQGIEAMSASTFAYKALTLKVVNADADFSKDAATIATTQSYLTPGLTADYHMNPSTVDINNIAELTFISDDKKYTKAAGAVVKAEVIGKSLAKEIDALNEAQSFFDQQDSQENQQLEGAKRWVDEMMSNYQNGDTGMYDQMKSTMESLGIDEERLKNMSNEEVDQYVKEMCKKFGISQSLFDKLKDRFGK